MKGLVRVANETSGEKAGLWSFLEEKPANQQPTANNSPTPSSLPSRLHQLAQEMQTTTGAPML